MDAIFGHHHSKERQAPPCELRRERAIANDPSRRREVICGAGDLPLEKLADGQRFDDQTCLSCPVPAALQSKLACMSLRPVRMVSDGRVKTYFSCRWFYGVHSDRQPESIDEACVCCSQWFPRPPFRVLEMLGYWRETEAVRATIANPSARPCRWYGTPPMPPQPTSFKGRTIRMLALVLSNFRMRPMF